MVNGDVAILSGLLIRHFDPIFPIFCSVQCFDFNKKPVPQIPNIATRVHGIRGVTEQRDEANLTVKLYVPVSTSTVVNEV